LTLDQPIAAVMSMVQSLREYFVLLGFILLCFAAAGLGSLATTPAIDGWYAALRKPAWTPPNWVFGPVWSLLYLGMAIAAWLVWRERTWASVEWPLFLFAIQLILNVVWSFLFFGARLPGVAFAEILLLCGAILATLVAFQRVSMPAALLLAPYLAWVTFAAFLNFSIWRMNAIS
jgi:tryptophan-rich sensory protein